jgi:hypothetical protein
MIPHSGQVVSAAAPRLVHFATKFTFWNRVLRGRSSALCADLISLLGIITRRT